MKRGTALLIMAATVLGSSYVGRVGAMTCNVNFNGQTIKIDTNPGVVDAQEGWSSYSGGTPMCPAYIQNSVIASMQAQSQVMERAERQEAETDGGAGKEDVSQASADDLARLVVRNIGQPSNYSSDTELRAVIFENFKAIKDHTNASDKKITKAIELVKRVYELE